MDITRRDAALRDDGDGRAEELVPEQRAYWVRVIQVDGERAWSSPIYVQPLADT